MKPVSKKRATGESCGSTHTLSLTPEEFIEHYGVKHVPPRALLVKGNMSKHPTTRSPDLRARMVVAPTGRSWQGRFTTADALAAAGMPLDKIYTLIQDMMHRKRKGQKGFTQAFIQASKRIGRTFDRAHTILAPDAPEILEKRTIFKKNVHPVTPTNKRLFSGGEGNPKLGKYMVGKRGELWGRILMLAFEERATCPTTCHHLRDCYANNSFMLLRWHYDTAREGEIQALLEADLQKHISTAGTPYVYVRLHVAGDFPTVRYVHWWEEMLAKYPRLMVFGYSHWPKETPIGQALDSLNNRFWHTRFRIFRSNGGVSTPRTANTVLRETDAKAHHITICPEQQRARPTCGECGLCLPGKESVGKNFQGPLAFLQHDVPKTQEGLQLEGGRSLKPAVLTAPPLSPQKLQEERGRESHQPSLFD